MFLLVHRILFSFLIILLINPLLSGNYRSELLFPVHETTASDTIKENQILYNGRVWRNLYYRVKDNQFLFSTEFIPGNLTISETSFENINLRYDIFKDEIMTVSKNGLILQLNKEKVDSFSLIFFNRKYRFINVAVDSVKGYNGYLNLLYKGKSELSVKYLKDIEFLAVDKRFDLFSQSHRIYFVTDSVIYPVNRAGDIYKAVPARKNELKSYVKKNKFLMSRKNPESFIPLIRYYDTINK